MEPFTDKLSTLPRKVSFSPHSVLDISVAREYGSLHAAAHDSDMDSNTDGAAITAIDLIEYRKELLTLRGDLTLSTSINYSFADICAMFPPVTLDDSPYHLPLSDNVFSARLSSVAEGIRDNNRMHLLIHIWNRTIDRSAAILILKTRLIQSGSLVSLPETPDVDDLLMALYRPPPVGKELTFAANILVSVLSDGSSGKRLLVHVPYAASFHVFARTMQEFAEYDAQLQGFEPKAMGVIGMGWIWEVNERSRASTGDPSWPSSGVIRDAWHYGEFLYYMGRSPARKRNREVVVRFQHVSHLTPNKPTQMLSRS